MRENARLGDEPRLADAGVRDDLEQLQLAQPRSPDRIAKHVELRLAPDDRARIDRRPRAAAARLADGVGQDRGLLALHEQRLHLRRVRRARAVENVCRREDRPGRRPGGQPRGEVDGVAHDRVRPSRRRADVAGEDPSAVDAGLEREPDVGGHDVPQRSEHRLLVLTGRRGSAGGEVHLRGVGVDVRLEPRQPVAPAGVGDDACQRVEPTGDLGRILVGGVGAGRLDERDGDLAVLRLAARDGQVVAQGTRDVRRKVAAADGLGWRYRARAVWQRSEQVAVVTGSGEPRRVDPSRRSRRSGRPRPPRRGPRGRTRAMRLARPRGARAAGPR